MVGWLVENGPEGRGRGRGGGQEYGGGVDWKETLKRSNNLLLPTANEFK